MSVIYGRILLFMYVYYYSVSQFDHCVFYPFGHSGDWLNASQTATEYTHFYKYVREALLALPIAPSLRIAPAPLAPGGARSCQCCGSDSCQFQGGDTGLVFMNYMAGTRLVLIIIWC